jgi:Uncharacterized conserved protein
MANTPDHTYATDTTATDPAGGWDLFRLPGHNAGWFLFRGLLAIAFGIIALFLPGTAVLAAAMLFAAFVFIDGIFSLISGIRGARHHTERWGSLVFSGVIGIAVGVLFVIWPLMSAYAYAFVLVLCMAAFYLGTGVGQISAAIRLRRQIDGEWLLGLLGVTAVLVGLALIYILLTNPAVTVLAVAWLIGFHALLTGAMLVALWFRLRKA